MRAIITASLLFVLVNSQAHLQVKPEGCKPPKVIFCGEEEHELSQYECGRYDFMFCTKTLMRKAPFDKCVIAPAQDWDRSKPWRVLLSQTEIRTLPCLNMDESSLTLICNEDRCNDTLVDQGIAKCTEKFTRGLLKYAERGSGFAPSSCPTCPTHQAPSYSDAHLIAFFIIIAFLGLQTISTCRNSSKLEKLRFDLTANAALPETPKMNDENYELLPVDLPNVEGFPPTTIPRLF